VIVFSILLAVGIDAWWGERQLQQDLLEDRQLAGIRGNL
jgi:hypothetical protein